MKKKMSILFIRIFGIGSLFFIDRVTKMYLINLQSTGTDVDFYISPYLNFYLVFNTGIGFGLVSLESNIYYHILTAIIAIINIVLIIFLQERKVFIFT